MHQNSTVSSKSLNRMATQGFFDIRVPAQINMARLTVDFWAENGRGQDVAIYYEDQKITYQQLKEQTDSFAYALHKMGISKGDRIIIRCPNRPEYQIGFLGGLKIGAVPIPTNEMLRENELEYIIKNSGAVAAIATVGNIATIENIASRCKTLKHIIVIEDSTEGKHSFAELLKEDGTKLPFIETLKDDPAFFLYTSGTTGSPKGVVHGHRFIIGAGDPIGKFTMGLEKGDICGGPTALTWMYALGHNFLFSLRWGVSTAMYADDRFDPVKAFQFIETYKLTLFTGTPTIYKRMLTIKGAENTYDISSLKTCLSSGEPLLAETWREWESRFGLKILDCLGQTEAHEVCTAQNHQKVKIGSFGTPLPGIEMAIVDKKGEKLPINELGHLVINKEHPGLFLEYFQMPDRMKEVFIPNGWYDTKDLAYMDEDGYFWYGSRSDDIMTCSGYRISPFEVQTALQEHPAVLESGVTQVLDSQEKDIVKAWVVLHAGYNPSQELAKELQDFVKKTIAPYKYPREIEFISELPKTSNGKILHRKLREMG